ncbi:MAG TPA: MBL fold metallo-hydrolase [Flavobacteriales bacterium]|jgi:glyoxylase-like metal-dependent hydrolase (beta-lactamase superfamily II)/rhodanese-related sulfurtransferase|nr:MBL fold metallo-hydrolase [Flavobacteriales bacterium]
MFIQFFYTESIAHLSYMLIANDKSIVIDPKRDIQEYLDEAEKRNLEISGIFLTHPHADFVAGHIELSKETGAPIYAHKDAPFKFDFIPVDDDFTMTLNHLKIDGMTTPGHSPFDVSYVVTDTSRGEAPVSVFTGDTLFVNDIGRPDLFPGIQDQLAEQMFYSLQKLFKLPDFVEIYPAHAAGTLCGKKLAEKRSSTIGYERLYNEITKIENVKDFSAALLDDLPVIPRHFKRCAQINTENIAPLKSLKPVKKIDFDTFKQLENQAYIIDLRAYDRWPKGHIPNSYAFDFNHLPISQYAGWLLNPDKPILALTDDSLNLDTLSIQFKRVGLDQDIYLLENATETLSQNKTRLNTVPAILKEDFLELLKTKNIGLLDIRKEGQNDLEYEHYINIPLMSLEENLHQIDDAVPYVVFCDYGISSVAAASILQLLGKNNIRILAEGIQSVL